MRKKFLVLAFLLSSLASFAQVTTNSNITGYGGGGSSSPAGSSGQIQYNNASAFGAANLYVEDANTFAQRNGATAQASYVYNTYTNASNYERGIYRWSSNVLELGFDKLGTGVDRSVRIRAGNNKEVQIVNASGFGVSSLDANTGGFRSYGLGLIGFQNGEATLGGSWDTALARNSAKVIEVNAGAAGTYPGTALVLGPQTVAQLPTCASGIKGARASVSDATQTFTSANFGTTVTGSSTNFVPVVCDGTNWKIGFSTITFDFYAAANDDQYKQAA